MASYQVARRGPGWNEARAQMLSDPEALLARSDAFFLKRRDAGRTVGLVAVGGAPLVVKLYEEDGVVDALERLLLGSAAARAARGIARMGKVGLPAPELVAALETALFATPRRSVLVTRAVAGERADQARERLPDEQRVRFAARLGDYVRELHRRGAYPQDLGMTNLIAAAEGDGWRWVLVDLDRVRLYRRLSWRRRRKNLVQIERSLRRGWSEEERAAFFAGYLGSPNGDEIARLASEVSAAGRRKDARRGTGRV